MTVYDPILLPWIKTGLNSLLMENEQEVRSLLSQCTAESSMSASQKGRQKAVRQRTVQPYFAKEGQKASVSVQGRSFVKPEPRRQSADSMTEQRYGADRKPAASAFTPIEKPASANSRGEKGIVLSAAKVQEKPISSSAALQRPLANAFSLPGAIPAEEWPDLWLALKKRRPLPPSPQVLWTYNGLGDDLAGTPDPKRCQVIVRMIKALNHPGGTHVFWPCSLPDAPCKPKPSLFWSGVRLLDPNVLLIFGSEARDLLNLPKSLLAFSEERMYGKLIIQLPGTQSLSSDENTFQRVQAFLSRRLSFCALR